MLITPRSLQPAFCAGKCQLSENLIYFLCTELTLRGLQETRVATREESGVLGFPSRRGLTLLSQLCRDPAVGVRNGQVLREWLTGADKVADRY